MNLSKASLLLLIGHLCLAQSESLDSPTESKSRLVKRGDIRAALAKLDPNFWPARGRRSELDEGLRFTIPKSKFDDEEEPFRRSDAVLNRGRKTNEEDPGVFWAGRGRNVDMDERSLENDPLETFWANRGRSLDEEPFDNEIKQDKEGDKTDDLDDASQEEMDTRWRRHRLFVEEPGWIWLSRRESHSPYDVSFAGASKPDKGKVDLFWVARGKKHKKQKREVSRFRPDPCWSFHPKRNSKNVIRELSQLNQNHFWPARGKRPLSDLAERVAEAFPNSFWPARGRRTGRDKEELPKRQKM